MSARKLARLALLTAVALSLFVVELQLPDLFPIPGAKLGLANIITVYALYRCRAGEAAMVLAARILLGGLLGGRGIAILYSAAGGAACFAGMLLLKRADPGAASVAGERVWRGAAQSRANGRGHGSSRGRRRLPTCPFCCWRAARRGPSPACARSWSSKRGASGSYNTWNMRRYTP